jgi:hypothetical protein
MGSYLSIENNTDNTWLCKIGPDQTMMMLFGGIMTVLGTMVFALSPATHAAESVLSVITSGSAIVMEKI